MAGVIAEAVKERPILFSGPMVRAILDGRKTQTRRVVSTGSESIRRLDLNVKRDRMKAIKVCPYGQPGDRLWVRETWQIRSWDTEEGDVQVFYKASPEIYWALPVAAANHPFAGDDPAEWAENDFDRTITKLPSAKIVKDDDVEGGERWDWDDSEIPWRPSIHMPRWACRIVLEVTGVRVERLQDITEEDAEREGFDDTWLVKNRVPPPRVYSFKSIWDGLNSKRGYSWDSNPWVWVVSFKRVERG